MDETRQLNTIPLVDPKNGEELKLNGEGVFVNSANSCFAVTDTGFVIELIDPETKGKAHLDGNFLISDITGKKYPIDGNGQVVVQQIIKEEKKVKPILKPQKKEIEEEMLKQYKDYVEKVSDLLSNERGITVEFSINEEDTICSTKASRNKGKEIVYAKQFYNSRKFQKNVLFVLVDEFSKSSNNIDIDIKENENTYDCTLRKKDGNSILLYNITEGCLEQVKYEYNQSEPGFKKKEVTPLEYNPITKVEEKEEKVKFYVLTVSLVMLVAVSIIGVILLFG